MCRNQLGKDHNCNTTYLKAKCIENKCQLMHLTVRSQILEIWIISFCQGQVDLLGISDEDTRSTPHNSFKTTKLTNFTLKLQKLWTTMVKTKWKRRSNTKKSYDDFFSKKTENLIEANNYTVVSCAITLQNLSLCYIVRFTRTHQLNRTTASCLNYYYSLHYTMYDVCFLPMAAVNNKKEFQ